MSDIETAKTTEQMGLDEQDLRRLLNMSECAMFVAKPGSQIELMYANERFYSLMQCTREEFSEIYHGSVMEMILPEDRQKIRNLIARQTAVGGQDSVRTPCAAQRRSSDLGVCFSASGRYERAEGLFCLMFGHHTVETQSVRSV